VKSNLQKYTAIILVFSGLAVYVFVLPESHRQFLETLSGRIPSFPLIGLGIFGAVFWLLGWILICGFEIHDKFYDRHVTKWRRYYDLDFILPALVRPFAQKLDKRFFDEAGDHKYEFMKPFYHFVGDVDPKIGKNFIVRFYESITKYWITQINEILLFFLLLLTFAYYFVYRSFALPLEDIVIAEIVIVALLVTNRAFVLTARRAVRLKTADEIEEILVKFPNELEEQLKGLHAKFNLKYE